MKPIKESRRARERKRKRAEILNAALALFSEKGFYNTAMQEIAEASEFAIGTLYKFFENKEELYKAIIAEEVGKCLDVLEKATHIDGDPVKKLIGYVETKSRLFMDNLPFIRLYIAESRGIGFNIKSGMDIELRERYYRNIDKVSAVFEEGIKQKQFKAIAAPYQLAAALDSTLDSFLLLWLDAPDRYRYPENSGDILEIFLRGLLV